MVHSHPNLVITSGLTGHVHTAHNSGLANCNYAPPPDYIVISTYHNHLVGTNPADSHQHNLTVSIDSAALGSPWWNHVHTVTLVSETNGGASHQHAQSVETSECDACAGFGHGHTSGNSGAGGAAHNTHTVTTTTSTADPSGTPEAHTHTVTFTTGTSGGHTHTAVALASALCHWLKNHFHTLSGWLSKTHTHTGSGTTEEGGEAEVTGIASHRLLVGVGR